MSLFYKVKKPLPYGGSHNAIPNGWLKRGTIVKIHNSKCSNGAERYFVTLITNEKLGYIDRKTLKEHFQYACVENKMIAAIYGD